MPGLRRLPRGRALCTASSQRRALILPDGFFCGGQGHDYDERIPAICIGHRATHLMFNDAPQYTDPAGEGRDIPLGALGEKYVATTPLIGHSPARRTSRSPGSDRPPMSVPLVA